VQIYPTLDTGPKPNEKTADKTVNEVARLHNNFARKIRKSYENFATAFNGQVSFGNGTNRDNIDGVWIAAGTPGTANTPFTLTHNLGRIPVGVDVKMKSAACDVYWSAITPPTITQITLLATVAGVNLNLFIH
jgi:hypothetical protein